MEVLRQTQPTHECLSGFSLVAASQLREIHEEEGNEKVYVAVGKSVGKGMSLLHWTFKRFGSGRGICILHVHQPSPLIPALWGRLPASQASAEVVSAIRREERECK